MLIPPFLMTWKGASDMAALQPKLPVLYYEDEESGNPFPYIECQVDDPFPKVLFVHEYRHTGEFEPDDEGSDAPIVDMMLHKFVDLEFLKESLDDITYDVVRVALGMKPLKEAQVDGAKIMAKAISNTTKTTNN